MDEAINELSTKVNNRRAEYKSGEHKLILEQLDKLRKVTDKKQKDGLSAAITSISANWNDLTGDDTDAKVQGALKTFTTTAKSLSQVLGTFGPLPAVG